MERSWNACKIHRSRPLININVRFVGVVIVVDFSRGYLPSTFLAQIFCDAD